MRSRTSGFSIVAFLAVLLVTFLAVPGANAQSTTDGAIGGTVPDPAGAVVTHAAVSSRNLRTASSSSSVPDGSGRYFLAHLQPGLYCLEVAGTSLAVFKATNI